MAATVQSPTYTVMIARSGSQERKNTHVSNSAYEKLRRSIRISDRC